MITASDYDETFNLMTPEQQQEIDFIITAQNWDGYQDIKNETDPDRPIFFNPGKQDYSSILNHKAKIINETGAKKFYDDDMTLVPVLRLMCPKCTIIHFKT